MKTMNTLLDNRSQGNISIYTSIELDIMNQSLFIFTLMVVDVLDALFKVTNGELVINNI